VERLFSVRQFSVMTMYTRRIYIGSVQWNKANASSVERLFSVSQFSGTTFNTVKRDRRLLKIN